MARSLSLFSFIFLPRAGDDAGVFSSAEGDGIALDPPKPGGVDGSGDDLRSTGSGGTYSVRRSGIGGV